MILRSRKSRKPFGAALGLAAVLAAGLAAAPAFAQEDPYGEGYDAPDGYAAPAPDQGYDQGYVAPRYVAPRVVVPYGGQEGYGSGYGQPDYRPPVYHRRYPGEGYKPPGGYGDYGQHHGEPGYRGHQYGNGQGQYHGGEGQGQYQGQHRHAPQPGYGDAPEGGQ